MSHASNKHVALIVLPSIYGPFIDDCSVARYILGPARGCYWSARVDISRHRDQEARSRQPQCATVVSHSPWSTVSGHKACVSLSADLLMLLRNPERAVQVFVALHYGNVCHDVRSHIYTWHRYAIYYDSYAQILDFGLQYTFGQLFNVLHIGVMQYTPLANLYYPVSALGISEYTSGVRTCVRPVALANASLLARTGLMQRTTYPRCFSLFACDT